MFPKRVIINFADFWTQLVEPHVSEPALQDGGWLSDQYSLDESPSGADQRRSPGLMYLSSMLDSTVRFKGLKVFGNFVF